MQTREVRLRILLQRSSAQTLRDLLRHKPQVYLPTYYGKSLVTHCTEYGQVPLPSKTHHHRPTARSGETEDT